MRPISLKISGFGPYVKKVDLDFNDGLRGENFFLIHGQTGSGKTMILDAICFALYGESSGGGRKSSMFRAEMASPNEKTEVEFVFSLRGKIYRIVRRPKYLRASKRGDKLTEEKASAEIFEDGTKIFVRDVSEYVKDLLKFDCERFRQVVVLPQGSFQKFLKAKSNERQEVLDTLFDAEFFRRVEEELKIKSATAQKYFENLDGDRKKYLDDAQRESGFEENFDERLLPEYVKNLSDELEAATAQIKSLDEKVNTAQKNFSDGENLAKEFKKLSAKSRELTEAKEALAKISSELAAAKVEFELRQSEEPRREQLKLLLAKLDEKKSALRNLDAKRHELQAAVNEAKKFADEVRRLEKKKRDCDLTMAQLQTKAEELRDAPVQKDTAEKILRAVETRQELSAKVSAAEKLLFAATETYNAAEKTLAELRERQISGSAATLAKTLADGVPCPVCGALHHPKPATSNETIPTDAQIKAAEMKFKTATDDKNSAEKNLTKLKTQFAENEKSLSDCKKIPTVAEAKANFNKLSADVKELEKTRDRIERGKKITGETEDELSAAREADKKKSTAEAALRSFVESMEQNIDKKYSADSHSLDEEISAAKKTLDELEAAHNFAQNEFNRLNNSMSAQQSTVTSAQRNLDEVAAQVEGKTLPDVDALKKILDDTRAAHIKAVELRTTLSARHDRLKNLAKKISALADDLKFAEKNLLLWKTLYETASGKVTKISFRRYYLATMFNEVVNEANNRLEKMSSGRYRFQIQREVIDRRSAGGLDLEIHDDYTDTARSVETLSGGESFLASLSLALGLAAVVQNNSGGVKLDTIFIDEGFGTLDGETLDVAMKALIELQRGGRLVGIISHVEELKNQISVRLEVTKTKTGSTAKFIS